MTPYNGSNNFNDVQLLAASTPPVAANLSIVTGRCGSTSQNVIWWCTRPPAATDAKPKWSSSYAKKERPSMLARTSPDECLRQHARWRASFSASLRRKGPERQRVGLGARPRLNNNHRRRGAALRLSDGDGPGPWVESLATIRQRLLTRAVAARAICGGLHLVRITPVPGATRLVRPRCSILYETKADLGKGTTTKRTLMCQRRSNTGTGQRPKRPEPGIWFSSLWRELLWLRRSLIRASISVLLAGVLRHPDVCAVVPGPPIRTGPRRTANSRS